LVVSLVDPTHWCVRYSRHSLPRLINLDLQDAVERAMFTRCSFLFMPNKGVALRKGV
jgi:hypothetical protein